MALTPERLVRLREILATAPPDRLLLTQPQLVVFDLATCRALVTVAEAAQALVEADTHVIDAGNECDYPERELRALKAALS